MSLLHSWNDYFETGWVIINFMGRLGIEIGIVLYRLASKRGAILRP
jgi:hypothetical protein